MTLQADLFRADPPQASDAQLRAYWKTRALLAACRVFGVPAQSNGKEVVP